MNVKQNVIIDNKTEYSKDIDALLYLLTCCYDTIDG